MSWTSLFPRRKTIYLKILVLIPFSWMMITLLISLNGGSGGGNSLTPIQRLQQEKQQQQHHSNQQQQSLHRPLSQNNPSVDGEEEGEREQVARAQNVMKISQIHGYDSSKNKNNNNNYNKNNKRSRSDIDSNEVEKVKDQESAAVLPPPRSSIHNGPGELGKAVHLPKNLSSSVQKLVDQGWSDNAFNQYVSDMISISRSLPDVRDPK